MASEMIFSEAFVHVIMTRLFLISQTRVKHKSVKQILKKLSLISSVLDTLQQKQQLTDVIDLFQHVARASKT